MNRRVMSGGYLGFDLLGCWNASLLGLYLISTCIICSYLLGWVRWVHGMR